jgi:hypothetical protein
MAAMSEEDFSTFLRHIQAKARDGTLPPCPICGETVWAMHGPDVLITDRTVGAGGSKATLPVASVICHKCFYMHTFAWIPIEVEAKNG